MIELLVVIGIIAMLIVLSVTVYANFISLSKEQATAATISKINKILEQRKQAFDRLNLKDAADKYSEKNSWLSGSKRLAEVIVRKQRFQQAFPQRVEDRAGIAGSSGCFFNGFDYKPDFQSFPGRATFESAALLYLAITQGETFGAPAVDEDAFSANEIQEADFGTPPKVKYFVDAWGQPLRFYRWPTSLMKPAGAVVQQPDPEYAVLLISSLSPFDTSLPSALGIDLQPGIAGTDDDSNSFFDDITEIGWPGSDDPNPLNRDPDDPLDSISGLSAAVLTNFRDNFHFELTFHTPLIVSAGPNRQLGLFEPNDASTVNRNAMPGPGTLSKAAILDALSDNITNLNQRNKGN